MAAPQASTWNAERRRGDAAAGEDLLQHSRIDRHLDQIGRVGVGDIGRRRAIGLVVEDDHLAFGDEQAIDLGRDGAARDDVAQWCGRHTARMPLEQRHFQELAQVYAQSVWAHFVKGEDKLEQMGPALINWMHLAKSAFIDCRGTGSERQDLLALFYLGYEMNAYLPRQQALEVWDRIIARKCVKPGSLADDWLRLHRAVAARDAAERPACRPRMGRAAEVSVSRLPCPARARPPTSADVVLRPCKNWRSTPMR